MEIQQDIPTKHTLNLSHFLLAALDASMLEVLTKEAASMYDHPCFVSRDNSDKRILEKKKVLAGSRPEDKPVPRAVTTARLPFKFGALSVNVRSLAHSSYRGKISGMSPDQNSVRLVKCGMYEMIVAASNNNHFHQFLLIDTRNQKAFPIYRQSKKLIPIGDMPVKIHLIYYDYIERITDKILSKWFSNALGLKIRVKVPKLNISRGLNVALNLDQTVKILQQ